MSGSCWHKEDSDKIAGNSHQHTSLPLEWHVWSRPLLCRPAHVLGSVSRDVAQGRYRMLLTGCLRCQHAFTAWGRRRKGVLPSSTGDHAAN